MSLKVLILLHAYCDHLLLALNSKDKLGSVVTYTFFTALLSLGVRRSGNRGLLKMNQDVNGAVKLSGNVVAVVIPRVFTVRLTLRPSVVALAHIRNVDLTVAFDGGAKLLHAGEAV